MKNLIVTHAGAFHADECLAIATLRFFHRRNYEVKRVFDVSEHISDHDVYVLDIGREYKSESLNFDHHQDENLPASNILILRHVLEAGKLRDLMEEYLYAYVSDCDLGGEKAQGVPSLTSIVRGLNNLPEGGFESAVQICETAVMSAYYTAKARCEAEAAWANVEKIGKIAITDSSSHIVGWQELAEQDGILLFVTPNARGGYQVASRSTDVFVIPTDPRQTFRHNTGFIAAYPDKESAIAHATKITL